MYAQVSTLYVRGIIKSAVAVVWLDLLTGDVHVLDWGWWWLRTLEVRSLSVLELEAGNEASRTSSSWDPVSPPLAQLLLEVTGLGVLDLPMPCSNACLLHVAC